VSEPIPELQEMPPIDTAPDVPKPKRRGRPPGRKDSAPRATPSTRKPPQPSLQKRLAGSLTTFGTVACLFHQGDGMLIVQHAESVSKALAKLASENAAIAANLERMLTAGTYGALFAALLPLFVGIAANHGLLPGELARMVAPAGAAHEGANEANAANDASGTPS
jgi:hypothetical protein